ncbi:DUF6147 family protein [Faecalicatena fissicatena]|uniref:Uncharacterized protein n=1 Tax=Faecalicatena fissicatena TaxID=290055 RepID=A0ABS2EA48_9FIRM|nr:DUF6147 family protein [Faecalicatena fissicatena]MBM6738452.1 hypothetical protein [Faecalicatena fissicatena]
MKKRLISVCFAAMLMMGLTITAEFPTKANESKPMLDGSYLTCEDESTGIAGAMTRGVDLQTGYSKIRELGPGQIYAGGTTIAQHEVELVKVAVIVERAKDENDTWHYVDSWQKENKNTYVASTSKLLEVEGDWYYRVRCVHSAGNDLSSSYTDGLYIHEPEED